MIFFNGKIPAGKIFLHLYTKSSPDVRIAGHSPGEGDNQAVISIHKERINSSTLRCRGGSCLTAAAPADVKGTDGLKILLDKCFQFHYVLSQ